MSDALDAPDVTIEPVEAATPAGDGSPPHSDWSVRVNGREVKRFPNREAAHSFVYQSIRKGSF